MVRVLGKSNAALTVCYEKIKSDNIIDSEKARRASQALNFHDNSMCTEDFQHASPPRCQSETDMSCDSDADSLSSCYSTQPHSPMNERHAEVVQRRKERRRERNKLSAQAYRQRKREEIQNQDKIVVDLEEHQKRLQDRVAELEQEKLCVENIIRNRVQFLPWFHTNVNNNGENNINDNKNQHFYHDAGNKKHCDGTNGDMTMTVRETSCQGQNMMSLPRKHAVAS
ncbi:hypothetical protein LOTGIDRAFT_233905 [Lottia gigantea]|uniref:BZIP domain-containing protein n=1 Tax=Lottia gigantea TaxID=225164 RepID=V4A9W9_LOTGI|nr:hypothetical protein LOTGIDRAFT_233905 [Lottia gigantea]ESO90096.1 hypothetical protein LOTGIDRAFT_233905 [Lottia gigantea]